MGQIIQTPFTHGLSSLVNPTKIEEYVSPEQTLAAAGLSTLVHGLSKKPQIVQVYLICKTAEFNYSVGDEVYIGDNSTTATTNKRLSIEVGDTDIELRQSDAGSPFGIGNKTTGVVQSPTLANWKLIVKAYAFTIGDIPDIITVPMVALKTINAGNLASMDFDTVFNDSDYEDFILRFRIKPVTDQVELRIRITDDNGVTFEAGTNYQYLNTMRNSAGGDDVTQGGTAIAYIQMTSDTLVSNSMGNAALEGGMGEIKFHRPATPGLEHMVRFEFTYFNTTGALTGIWGTGSFDPTAAWTGMQLLFDSGNIAEGVGTMFGIKKTS